jgi:cytochrome d ubiquinol oxidase subunit II
LLAVAFSGYLAAVYLAADSIRFTERALAADFRDRALISGLIAGGLALAGLFTLRSPTLPLTHGLALAMVIISGCAGLATLVLCWMWRFGLARLTAALAVATVVIGWAAAQEPRFLPGMTVTQAAAGRSALIALIVAVAVGSVILVPSLILLFTLFLRGQLDEPDSSHPTTPDATATPTPVTTSAPRVSLRLPTGALAVVTLVAGAGLVVFAGPTWAQGIGVVSLVVCAVAVFALAVAPAQTR